MSDTSWEEGLNALIARAEQAEAAARDEVRYIETLERFIGISRDLRELFRRYVVRESVESRVNGADRYAVEADAKSIAPRFAPSSRPREIADEIARQLNGGL